MELLCVMAVMGLLVSAMVPAVSSYATSQRRTKFLYEISGLFETARQYATSRNTYVWVAFSDDAITGRPLYATLIASKTGLGQGFGPEDSWTVKPVNLQDAGSGFALAAPVKVLGDFKLTEVPGETAFSRAVTFTVPRPGGDITLGRSVQFSPSGEARASAALFGQLIIDASATEGRMREVKDRITLNGATGFCRLNTY